jgi:hypothetical protein
MSSEDLIREAQDPATPPGRLAELAQIDRSTWAAIVFNPAAYDGLLQWLGERGDPTVNAALSARSAAAAAQQPPVASAPATPPVEPSPVVPTSVAEARAAQPPVEEPTPSYEPEPTAVIPTEQPASPEQPTYPAQSGYAAAPVTAAFGSAPPGGPQQQPATTGGGAGRPLGIVIAMVVVIIALLGGAAFGATQVFGGDDDDNFSATDTKTRATPEPTADDDDDDDDAPTIPAPTVPTPATPDPGDGGGASSEFCQAVEDTLESSIDIGGTTDLDDIKQKAGELAVEYQALGASAPAEMKSDIEVMENYFNQLKGASPGDASKLSDSIAEYSKAASNLGVYYGENCF